jgi:4-hydroxybenzoate polyprenyltransferase
LGAFFHRPSKYSPFGFSFKKTQSQAKPVSCPGMRAVKIFFSLIRWPNLIIIALLQVVVFLRLMQAPRSLLSGYNLAMLMLITALISAGGYVINDYFDVEIDKINKPQKWLSRETWNQHTLWRIFLWLTGIGLLLTLMASYRFGLVFYLTLYFGATLGLYVYSAYLKCLPVVGNLVVALYCAATILIVATPDLHAGTADILLPGFYFYIFFAFCITLYREIIKDLEDVSGDQHFLCKTFVVRFGLNAGKGLAILVGLILITAMEAWKRSSALTGVEAGLWILQAGTVVTLLMLALTSRSDMFHRTSLLVKFLMMGGTLLLFLQG